MKVSHQLYLVNIYTSSKKKTCTAHTKKMIGASGVGGVVGGDGGDDDGDADGGHGVGVGERIWW